MDPEDWRSGRTSAEIVETVEDEATSNDDTILLHSRLSVSADATPEVVAHLQSISGMTWDSTIQGRLGSVCPPAGFAGLSSISVPPTSAELATAREFFVENHADIGPYFSGTTALGIMQLSQEAGAAEVEAFLSILRPLYVETEDGSVHVSTWMSAYLEWDLFRSYADGIMTNQPFPRVEGLTL